MPKRKAKMVRTKLATVGILESIVDLQLTPLPEAENAPGSKMEIYCFSCRGWGFDKFSILCNECLGAGRITID